MMGTNGMKVVGAILYLSVRNEHSLSTASSLFLDILGLETSRIISEILERAGVTDTKTRLSLATSMISRNLKNAASKKKLLTRFKVEEGTDKAKVAVVNDKKPSSASKPVPSSKMKKPSPPSLKKLLPSSSSSPSTPTPNIINEKSKAGLKAEVGIGKLLLHWSKQWSESSSFASKWCSTCTRSNSVRYRYSDRSYPTLSFWIVSSTSFSRNHVYLELLRRIPSLRSPSSSWAERGAQCQIEAGENGERWAGQKSHRAALRWHSSSCYGDTAELLAEWQRLRFVKSWTSFCTATISQWERRHV